MDRILRPGGSCSNHCNSVGDLQYEQLQDFGYQGGQHKDKLQLTELSLVMQIHSILFYAFLTPHHQAPEITYFVSRYEAVPQQQCHEFGQFQFVKIEMSAERMNIDHLSLPANHTPNIPCQKASLAFQEYSKFTLSDGLTPAMHPQTFPVSSLVSFQTYGSMKSFP